MSIQVSLRLEDRLVDFLDQEVASGRARSRAELVESALEREFRRRLYERDADIYRRTGEDPELAGLHTWARNRTFPDLG